MTICPKFLMVSIAFAFVLGCSGSRKTESAVVDRIQHCSSKVDCRIAIRDVTAFDWDHFYAFKYTSSLVDREKALGTKDSGFWEFRRQLVFLEKGRVVYQESEPTDVEHPVKDEVVFDIPDDADFKVYGRDAQFKVIEEQGLAGRYFLLNQVQ